MRKKSTTSSRDKKENPSAPLAVVFTVLMGIWWIAGTVYFFPILSDFSVEGGLFLSGWLTLNLYITAIYIIGFVIAGVRLPAKKRALKTLGLSLFAPFLAYGIYFSTLFL